jgi:predicted dehydrogenase
LLEKPACISAEEAELLCTAAERSEAQLGICFQNRYLEGVEAAKRFLSDKKILGMAGAVLWRRDREYYLSSDWRGKRATEGGGVLINQAIHTLDLMLWLGGMPEFVTATVSNRHLPGVIDVEDTAECYWETENGGAILYATTAASKNYPVSIKIDAGCHTVEITGGSCEIDGVKLSDARGNNPAGKDYWGITG